VQGTEPTDWMQGFQKGMQSDTAHAHKTATLIHQWYQGIDLLMEP
jgi:hypothetical protein